MSDAAQRAMPHELSRPQIQLFDAHFAHAAVAGTPDVSARPTHFEWVRDEAQRPVSVFTDSCLDLVESVRSELKVAWMLESPAVARRAYRRIAKSWARFDRVATFDRSLLSLDDRFCFSPLGGCWIDPQVRRVHPKSQLVSMIASAKSATVGQRLRHRVIKKVRRALGDHVYGSGYRRIGNKAVALAPFRYSIVIENASVDAYFSEKLIDAFVVGTVPIYWGCPSVGEFFDADGIIRFSTVQELEEILSSVSHDDYERRSRAVARNFETAQLYTTPEDQLWHNCLVSCGL